MSRFPMVCATCVATLLLGCADGGGLTPPITTAIAVAATNGQRGNTSSALPIPLGVLVESDGQPAAGVLVTWTTLSGSVTPGSSTTGADGIAGTTWILGPTPGQVSASAAIADGETVVTFSATASPIVTLTIDPASDGQSGTVGEPLSMPIRIRVLSDGRPRASTAVAWTVSAGTIKPDSPLTDTEGNATATWTLGTAVGTALGSVSIREPRGGTVAFTATARPGAPSIFTVVKGQGLQQLPANPSLRDTLAVQLLDRFGNPIPGVETSWVRQGGPLTLLRGDSATDVSGVSRATIAPIGEAGPGVIQVTTAIGGWVIDFPFLIEYRVRYDPSRGFISEQNGSMPAVDTIPVNATLHWILDSGDPVDHTLEAWTSLVYVHHFAFPIAPETITLAYPLAGVFAYSDIWTGLAGIVVVQ